MKKIFLQNKKYHGIKRVLNKIKGKRNKKITNNRIFSDSFPKKNRTIYVFFNLFSKKNGSFCIKNSDSYQWKKMWFVYLLIACHVIIAIFWFMVLSRSILINTSFWPFFVLIYIYDKLIVIIHYYHENYINLMKKRKLK